MVTPRTDLNFERCTGLQTKAWKVGSSNTGTVMAWNYLRSPNSPSFTHHDNRCLPALKHHDSRYLQALNNTNVKTFLQLAESSHAWAREESSEMTRLGMTFVRHTMITDCSTALLLHRTFLSSIKNPVWWSSRGRSGLPSKSQKHYNKMHVLINLEENYTCYILHPTKSNAWQIPKRNKTVHQTQAKKIVLRTYLK